MSYLGATLSKDGSVDHELSRRIGTAKGTFGALSKVWSRSCLTCWQKLQIFNALIVPNVLYGLAACCLNVVQKRRLNAFQCRCLRKLLGISPAYFSRVSNAEVLRRASSQPLADTLLDQQLHLLGKVLRTTRESPLRSCAFVPGTDQPLVSHYVRRVGRPRKEWVPTLLEAANSRNTSPLALSVLANDPAKWQRVIIDRQPV